MEDFGYSKDGDNSNILILVKKGFLVSATLFSIACFIYITIHAYNFVYGDKNENIELVKSPLGPIKIYESEETQEEGRSMKIDRSIYEDIFGNQKETAKKIKVRNAPEPALPPKKPAIAEKKSYSKPSPKKRNTEIVVYSDQIDQNGKIISDTSSNKPAKIETSQKKGIRVQIAAMTSKNSAQEFSNRLNRLHPSLFTNNRFFIEEVDLGKRGIFYRLQIGTFFNQIDAENFCGQYVAQTKKNKADCIVVE